MKICRGPYFLSSITLSATLSVIQPVAAQVSDPARVYGDARALLAIDGQCRQFDTTEKLALELLLEDTLASVPAAGQAAARASGDRRTATIGRFDCGSKEKAQELAAMKNVAREQTALWITRAYAVAVLPMTARWAAAPKAIASKRQGLTDRISAYRAVNPAAFDAMRKFTMDEAMVAALVVCRANPVIAAQCPATPVLDETQKLFALGRIKRLERMAAIVENPVAKLPPGVTRWSQVYAWSSPYSDMEIGMRVGGTPLPGVECLPTDYLVVVPVAPTDAFVATDGTAYRASGGPALGPVKVMANPLGYLTVRELPGGINKGRSHALRRCLNQ